ncbi:MAG: hypothetical protein QXD12_02350 [Candidatus Nezhaarchaeales archaeon]
MIIVKTLLGMDKVAAARIKELCPEAKIQVSPQGFMGLILVESSNEYELLDKINKEVVEAERVMKSIAECKAELREIASIAAEAVKGLIGPN